MKKVIMTIVCFLLLCFIGFIMYVKYWIGPEFVRQRFGEAVTSFWHGQLQFKEVQFNFFSDQIFKGVAFLDNKGRQWGYADTINATLGDWPGRDYYLKDVNIDKLTVLFHMDTDKETFPLKPAFSASARKDPTAALQSVNINTGSVSVINVDEEELYLGDLLIVAQRVERHFEFVALLEKPSSLNELTINGTFNAANSEIDIDVGIDRIIEKNETSLLIPLLDLPEGFRASGKLLADLSIKGRANELSEILLNGDINLGEWDIYVESTELLATDINAAVAIDDHHLELEKFSANICDGLVEASVRIDNYRSQEMGIIGQLRVDSIDLGKLASKLNYEKITTGKATLEYFYTAQKMDIDTLSGYGSLSINDADMLPIPLLTKISKTIGLTNKDLQTTSDAKADFSFDGLTLRINEAYFTNRYEAIIIEPGGTIDLQNRYVDMHVTAIQLKQIGSFIRKVPVLKLFAGFKDKLMRLRIEGKWSDPDSKLIRKEPVKDVTEGVVDFFGGVAETGGQLTEPILKGTKKK